MLPRDIPDSLWQEITTHFFTFDQHDFLLICKTFSKYPLLFETLRKTREATLEKFQQVFSQYGPAKCLYTDKSQAFSSERVTIYLASYTCSVLPHHLTTHSPRVLIKRHIKTGKEALIKGQISKQTIMPSSSTWGQTQMAPTGLPLMKYHKIEQRKGLLSHQHQKTWKGLEISS